jgi:hypothetical protein
MKFVELGTAWESGQRLSAWNEWTQGFAGSDVTSFADLCDWVGKDLQSRCIEKGKEMESLNITYKKRKKESQISNKDIKSSQTTQHQLHPFQNSTVMLDCLQLTFMHPPMHHFASPFLS